VYYWRKAY
jgi:metal-responsive CopG/Arc/MetJ family transcriptional regulator